MRADFIRAHIGGAPRVAREGASPMKSFVKHTETQVFYFRRMRCPMLASSRSKVCPGHRYTGLVFVHYGALGRVVSRAREYRSG